MELRDFDYNLPKELIAQEPVNPRDHSRLLILDRKNKKTEHKYFYNIYDYLKKGDVLVLNNSKVFPARLIGKKKDTGGKIEIFMLHLVQKNCWQCLIGGRGAREKLEVIFKKNLECKVLKNNGDGTWNIKFNLSGSKLMNIVYQVGETPLPPYIIKSRKSKVENRKSDFHDYQTVYANNKKIGSVAAPTAGFHFTPKLIKKLEKKGIQFEYLTLHVGLGTFAPVKEKDITKHKIHSEWVEVKKDVIKNVIKAKAENRRIIAVGTTSARTLEAVFLQHDLGKKELKIKSFSDWVNIFIYPGYKFKVVDCLITNFHLPKSTLLMLVSAFANKKNIRKTYLLAVKNKYRFFSYGDAMFIF